MFFPIWIIMKKSSIVFLRIALQDTGMDGSLAKGAKAVELSKVTRDDEAYITKTLTYRKGNHFLKIKTVKKVYVWAMSERLEKFNSIVDFFKIHFFCKKKGFILLSCLEIIFFSLI